MKILIIEDQIHLAQSIGTYLSSEDYLCEFAFDYDEALVKINLYRYDCILLDLMLPGGEGLQILELLKTNNRTEGVIIISAKDAHDDKIRGLQIGADDYLAKPFHLPELAARIFSLIRRRNFGSSNVIIEHEIRIDLLAKVVSVHNNPVILTKKEFDLLLFFLGSKNRVISKSALAEHLSGDLADMLDSYDFVYAHVKNLRRKMVEADYGHYLKNIYGSGYKWES